MVTRCCRGIVTRIPSTRGRHGWVARGRAPITGSGSSRGRRIPCPEAGLLLSLVTSEAGICRGAVRQFLDEGLTLLCPLILVTTAMISVSAPRAAPASISPTAPLLAPEKVLSLSQDTLSFRSLTNTYLDRGLSS